MKIKRFVLLLLLFFVLLITSCSMNSLDGSGAESSHGSASSDSGAGDSYYEPTGGYGGKMSDEIGAEDAYSGISSPEPLPSGIVDVVPGSGNGNMPRAGQLTSCALFDKDYYDYWQSLLTKDANHRGLFMNYNNAQFNFFHTEKRIKVNVVELVYGIEPTDDYSLITDEMIVKDRDMVAEVSLLYGDKVVTKTITTKDGIAYLYGSELAGNKIQVKYYNRDNELITKTVDYTGEEEVTVYLSNYKCVADDHIQIMFVLDTTGSMGDEISFLKAEIDSVIGSVQSSNPNSTIDVAILLYRDTCDEQSSYLMNYHDFTTDINSLKQTIASQGAYGGGDFEEAVDLAFKEALNKSWDNNATKLLIHIADAPSHDKDVESWDKSVEAFKEKGIRIITVASSGIDKKTEFYFRSQSLITQGCYVYLTDDSGIGESHTEATVKERPVVELLNSCLIRLINGYHQGHFAEPVYYRQDAQ